MKANKTFILIDRKETTKSENWRVAHEAIYSAIKKCSWPQNATDEKFTLPRIIKLKPGDAYTTLGGVTAKWTAEAKNLRNGVLPLRKMFRQNLVMSLDWKAEEPLNLAKYFEVIRNNNALEKIFLYPTGEALKDPLHEGVGEFDFWFQSKDGFRVVVEWETGNISSLHRSLNKMCLALMGGLVDAAVLIVPSAALRPHLTDRIGNITELQPYFYFWQSVAPRIEKGLLAVIEVEQDKLIVSSDLRTFIPVGLDGNARRSANEIKSKVKNVVRTKASLKKREKGSL
jgi:Restriction endonuclease BamHI